MYRNVRKLQHWQVHVPSQHSGPLPDSEFSTGPCEVNGIGVPALRARTRATKVEMEFCCASWLTCCAGVCIPYQGRKRAKVQTKEQVTWHSTWTKRPGWVFEMISAFHQAGWLELNICTYNVYNVYIWARSPDPLPPQWYPPPLLTPPTPPKPSICMLFAHIHTHIHIYTPLSTPPTSHLYVICSTWEPRPRQRTLSTCIFLS